MTKIKIVLLVPRFYGAYLCPADVSKFFNFQRVQITSFQINL